LFQLETLKHEERLDYIQDFKTRFKRATSATPQFFRQSAPQNLLSGGATRNKR
jgi:hypothetical protein